MVSKEARQYVAKEIRRYHEIKNELTELEKDIIFGTPDTVGGTGISDSVGNKATALASNKRIQQMQLFINVFDDVYSQLPPEKQKMIKLLYWHNRYLNCNGVGRLVGADGSTIGRWRIAILSRIAERMGLE